MVYPPPPNVPFTLRSSVGASKTKKKIYHILVLLELTSIIVDQSTFHIPHQNNTGDEALYRDEERLFVPFSELAAVSKVSTFLLRVLRSQRIFQAQQLELSNRDGAVW